MKFGVRECANIVFRAKQPIRIGTATFQSGQPVLYIDSATTSSMEQATTTVYAQGGRGNARLLSWEGEKTLTFSFTDALLSPIGFAILSGAGLFKRGDGAGDNSVENSTKDLVHFHMTSGATLNVTGSGVNAVGTIDLRSAIAEFGSQARICKEDAPIYVMETESDGSLTGNIYTGTLSISGGIITITTPKIGTTNATSAAVLVDYYVDLPGEHVWEADITPETFGGNYYVEADTLFRDQKTGKDLPANLTFPNVKLQSNFTMTFAGSGDPSTFDFTMDAFPDFTYFDNKKKVLCALQIVDSIALGAQAAAAQAEDPVMYHDGVRQDAEAAAHDSYVTNVELGSGITSITWVSGDNDSTDAAYLPNLKDGINIGNYIKINTADGEKPLSEFAPTYVAKYGDGSEAGQEASAAEKLAAQEAAARQYIELSNDGYVVGIKDTDGDPVSITITFPQANNGSGITKTLEVHVVTDGRTQG